MLCTYPVRVRKVDANRCCRIAVTCKDAYGNHLGCYALDFCLAETRIDRRMIFKPLCIL